LIALVSGHEVGWRWMWLVGLLVWVAPALMGQGRSMTIAQPTLNVPIAKDGAMKVFAIQVDGVTVREFPAQLAEKEPDYWIFLDVSAFQGKTITISPEGVQAGGDSGSGGGTSAGLRAGLDRIYQANTIEGAADLYKERNRPQFHFTVKRGWSNDVNGPIFYQGRYHLFWQAFPFGVNWDTGFMYWGHAWSTDLIHWTEMAPALMLDKLSSPWSGTSFVDHDWDGSGKEALVLVYTAFDRVTKKQVQCLAYSTDGGAHFTRYQGNPVLDTNSEVGSNDTRDPKVFWYAPTKRWVMVLFEKDGMSFFNSTDLKTWTRKSHFKGLHECPDFFELAVEGDARQKKWVLHGGSSSYYVGTFDGEKFTPESDELRYAEGKNAHGDDVLYAAQSFVDMPDGRRVQMAWGRIQPEGMAFNQMMLFPTEFRLVKTGEGIRLRAKPIAEIEKLHGKKRTYASLTVEEANTRLKLAGARPLDVKLAVKLEQERELAIQFGGMTLATIHAAELEKGKGDVRVLIDKAVAEIFVDGGARYIVRELPTSPGAGGLELNLGQGNGVHGAGVIDRMEVDAMTSMWTGERGKTK